MPTSTTTRRTKATTSAVAATARKKPSAAKRVETATHPLAKLIPPSWFFDDYIPREIDGMLDIDILDYCRKTRENVLIYGPTGPGKTSCVYGYASKFQLPLVNVACNGAVDPATLFGSFRFNEDGKPEYFESDLVLVVRYGGVVYLDELNFAPPRIMAVLHGALDKRRIITIPEIGNKTIELHPECQIVASMNIGYNGTKPLNQAFANRFSWPLDFPYSEEIEARLITAIPTLLEVAKRLRAIAENGDLETPVSTNLLREFQDHALDLGVAGVPLAITAFVNHFQDYEKKPVRNVFEHFLTHIQAEVHAELAKG